MPALLFLLPKKIIDYIIVYINRKNTTMDKTDFVVTEYQFSGMSGSNPQLLA
jgi:hypothetical protein